MSVGKKLKQAIKDNSLTAKEFANKIGKSEQMIYKYYNMEDIDSSTIKLFCEILNLPITFFIEETNNAYTKEIDMFQNIPLVPIRAHAGYQTGYGDNEYIEKLPTVPVIVDKSYKGKYRCFEIDGDSMDDGSRESICDKDVVLCREVKRDLWCNKLHYKDWNFILVTKEGILAKRIIHHDIITCNVICHSLNPMYEDFEICLNDVYELYNIIKIVDRNARI